MDHIEIDDRSTATDEARRNFNENKAIPLVGHNIKYVQADEWSSQRPRDYEVSFENFLR